MGEAKPEMTNEARHLATVVPWAKRHTGTGDTLAAILCGIGDAAHLCDAIERDILKGGRTRDGNGAPSKHAREMAAAAKRCGDAIWALRQRVADEATNEKNRSGETTAASAALGR